jgi:hypothetical protein
MGQARVEDEIAVSADVLWELLRDFGGVQRWNPTLRSCELDKPGIGGVRTIKMGEVTVREQLEKLDDGAKALSYSIVEAPVPVRNYLATIEVAEAGPSRSRIVWSSTFEPVGMTDEQATQLFDGIYRQAIDGLRAALVR